MGHRPAAGRLVKIKDDSNNVIETYTYGATRERLITETTAGRTYYAWGGQSVIAEYTETSTTPAYSKGYVYAGSRLLMTATKASSSTETQEFHHPNRLGTELVTDGGAGTSYRQTTFPFGTPISAETTGNSNQVFTSYDRSAATGLDYAVNRTYSSGQSRFTQVDPIGMAAASIGDPQSLNMYAYVQNMPTDFVDPSGLEMFCSIQITWVCQGGECHVGPIGWDCRNIGNDGMPIVTDPGIPVDGGGNQQTEPQKKKKAKCEQKDDEQKDVKDKLEAAGLMGFIDKTSFKNRGEGVTFTITDREGFLKAISSNPAFAGPTPFGASHTGDVQTSYLKIKDFRSYTVGDNTLGADSSGLVRSLQVNIGKVIRENSSAQGTGPARGYADLDCDNPAQDLISFIKHAFKVLFGR